MKNYLCLDYGEKHVGAALATTFVAEPLEVIPTHQAISYASQIIQEYGITDIVLGISENQMAERTREFAQVLITQFHLPIHYHDETLTSQDTRRELAQLGAKRKTRQAKIDHYVAAAILQDFLDSHSE